MSQTERERLAQEAWQRAAVIDYLPAEDVSKAETANLLRRLASYLNLAASPSEAGTGVYVASRASVLARGEMWRAHRAAGAPIISSWIDEDGPNDTADLDELWVRIRQEVTSAAHLILYVEPDDFPLKGAFVEIGMALAANVPITIVAPGVEIRDRNCRPFGSWIKHPLVRFADTVEAALALRPITLVMRPAAARRRPSTPSQDAL